MHIMATGVVAVRRGSPATLTGTPPGPLADMDPAIFVSQAPPGDVSITGDGSCRPRMAAAKGVGLRLQPAPRVRHG
jgi:hypothetical protein